MNEKELKKEARDYMLMFGRHQYETLGFMIERDPNYAIWLLENSFGEVKEKINLLKEDIENSKKHKEEILEWEYKKALRRLNDVI